MRTTKWLPKKDLINHSLVKAEWFIFYLHKITTNAIIKAIAMIAIVTNPKISKQINCININFIAPPRFITNESV